MNKTRTLLVATLLAATVTTGCLDLFGMGEPEEAQGPEPAEPAEPSPTPANATTPTRTEPTQEDALRIPPDADARIDTRIQPNATISRTVQISPSDTREARFVANVTNLANETTRLHATATVPLVGQVASQTLVLGPLEARELNVTVTEAQIRNAVSGSPFVPSQIPVTVDVTSTGPVDVRGYVQVVER